MLDVAPFPRELENDVYTFDPTSQTEIARFKRGASQWGVLLAEEGDEVMDAQVRVSCGARDDKFGEEVPAELVEVGLLAEAGGRGMVEWDGSVRFVEEVPKSEMATLVQRWRWGRR